MSVHFIPLSDIYSSRWNGLWTRIWATGPSAFCCSEDWLWKAAESVWLLFLESRPFLVIDPFSQLTGRRDSVHWLLEECSMSHWHAQRWSPWPDEEQVRHISKLNTPPSPTKEQLGSTELHFMYKCSIGDGNHKLGRLSAYYLHTNPYTTVMKPHIARLFKTSY